MTVKVNKWGNSFALCLPSNIVKELNLQIGGEMHISLENEQVVLTPVKKELSLAYLCEGMDENNMHEEHFNQFIGREKF